LTLVPLAAAIWARSPLLEGIYIPGSPAFPTSAIRHRRLPIPNKNTQQPQRSLWL